MLEIAHELFYWHGIRAVGVDRIAAEAGVAPTTLYRLFASKDDLITAYVVRGGEFYQQWFEDALGDPADRDARTRVLSLFDALVDQVHPSRCRGCPFLIALAETPDPNHPANRAARATKAWVRQRFADLADEAGVPRPAEFAARLALVMEGVYASVQATGTDGPAHDARALVDDLFTLAGA
ncbi:TetR/AcrR family transcriptional regulator [Streptodolium elevatio]|uniref:TetR/AcrR family transcriptional regulator n=1 Tax=Streptodolium elevatio TaxID=3157996 RepID=A0ABV3DAG6_9ACTN